MMDDANQNHTNDNDTTQQRTVSKDEWDALVARLQDAEEHRKGLLQHAHNLEDMLTRKEKNVSDFLEHIKNMEHLLEEKESDLQKHRVRCYHLEQECNDLKKALEQERRKVL